MIKLPPKKPKDPTIYSAYDVGYNAAIDEIKAMNETKDDR